MKGWSITSYTFEDPAINPWPPDHVTILQEEQVHPLSPGLMPQEPHRVTWNILAKHASWTPFYLRELGGRTRELPGYKQKNIKMWASPQDNCPFLQQVNGMEKVGEGGRVDFRGLVYQSGLKWEGKMGKEAVGSKHRREVGLTQWDQESTSLQHHLPKQGPLCQIQLPPLLPSEGHGQILEEHQYLESQTQTATLTLKLWDEIRTYFSVTAKVAERLKALNTKHTSEPSSALCSTWRQKLPLDVMQMRQREKPSMWGRCWRTTQVSGKSIGL